MVANSIVDHGYRKCSAFMVVYGLLSFVLNQSIVLSALTFHSTKLAAQMKIVRSMFKCLCYSLFTIFLSMRRKHGKHHKWVNCYQFYMTYFKGPIKTYACCKWTKRYRWPIKGYMYYRTAIVYLYIHVATYLWMTVLSSVCTSYRYIII